MRRSAYANARLAALAANLLPAWLALSCHETTSPATTTLRQRWYVSQVGYSHARPAIAGDLVVFGTGADQVVARDRATGALRWAATPGTVQGAMLLARSGVVVAPVLFYTVAFDAVTGQELWRYAAPLDTVGNGTGAQPGEVLFKRLDADDQTVYVPSWGASVSAVDLRTGVARWTWQPGRSAGDTAASGVFRSGAEGVRVSGDTVFVSAWHFLDRLGVASEPWLIALERQTGRELWRVTLPSYSGGVITSGAPALAGHVAVLTGNGGHLYAVDRGTAQLAWQFLPPAQHATFAEGEAYGDGIYVDGGDGNVYAVDAASGQPLWKAPLDQFAPQATADLLVTETRVYVPAGPSLFVFDRTTGRRLSVAWQPGVAREASVIASPLAWVAGELFVTVKGGAWSFAAP